MNLSNYLQMPPAPQVPQAPSNGPATGTAAVVGLDSGGKMKLDFAQIMARQFQQLPAMKRQDLAALKHLSPPGEADTTRDDGTNRVEWNRPATVGAQDMHTSARANSAPIDHTAQVPRDNAPKAEPRETSSAATHAQGEDEHDDRANAQRRQRASARRADDAVAAEAALLMPLGLQVAATNTPEPAAALTVAANSAAPLPDGTPLHTIELSPQMRIITDPQRAPSPESLADFARSMGLDAQAIAQLMGKSAESPATTSLPQGLQMNLPQAPAAPGAGVLAAALTASANASITGDAATALTSQVATQVQAQTVGSPSQAVQAMPTLQVLSPTDPNALGTLQVNMLPVAPAMALQPGVGSFELINLVAHDLAEHDIAALSASLEAGDAALSQDGESAGNAESGTGGFAQALAAKNNTPAGSTPAAAAQARPMGEVYQQLSDKLSTEMAARMHQQLSAGQWKMKFGLRPAHLGGVEVQLEMKDGKLNAQINADNPLARELLQNGSQRLRESLANLGIQADQVTVGQNHSSAGQHPSQDQGSGNRPQVGDNLGPMSSTNPAPSASTAPGPKASDSLLDLYA